MNLARHVGLQENECITIVDANDIGQKAIDLQMNNIDYMAFSVINVYKQVQVYCLVGGFLDKDRDLGGGTVSL